jgi:hypothetical protein
MLNAKIASYARFEQLPTNRMVKRHGELIPRKIPRYDLTAIYGYWQGWDAIKGANGLFLNLIKGDKVASRDTSATVPSYYIQARPPKISLNFSGLRFAPDSATIASGEPPFTEKLKGGFFNPLYSYRNDGFLFKFSDDGQVLEVLVIKDGRLFIDAYRQQLLMGGFSEVLQSIRLTATLKV